MTEELDSYVASLLLGKPWIGLLSMKGKPSASMEVRSCRNGSRHSGRGQFDRDGDANRLATSQTDRRASGLGGSVATPRRWGERSRCDPRRAAGRVCGDDRNSRMKGVSLLFSKV